MNDLSDQRDLESRLKDTQNSLKRRLPEIWVAMVSRVVTPSDTRAGMALGSSQKETQETMTNIEFGM